MQRYFEIIQNQKRRIFFLLVMIVLLFAVLYGYFLNMVIVRVVAREAAMGAMSALDMRLSELEFAYIEKQNDIDIELAHERNFLNVEAPLFVSKDSGRSLTLVSEPGEL